MRQQNRVTRRFSSYSMYIYPAKLANTRIRFRLLWSSAVRGSTPSYKARLIVHRRTRVSPGAKQRETFARYLRSLRAIPRAAPTPVSPGQKTRILALNRYAFSPLGASRLNLSRWS